MDNLKISVITVCFNAEETIDETLLSVVNQSYNNIEYIIIDGKSNDSTLLHINRYKDKIDCIISEPDEGVYDAMNKGLKVANGDFVIFLGADDHFISYDIIADVVNLIREKDCVYYGNVVRSKRNDIYKGHFNKYKISLENICHQCIFYPRSVYKSYLYELKYKTYADYYYNLQIFPLVKFVYLPIIISYFNVGGISSSVVDKDFENDVLKLVLRQNGFWAYLLRHIYKFYKKIK